ncbi:DivIVA domain-containing protein [Clostridium celatum]|uniref:DivIVA domain protein n=1 Tax=Clostridium celatum DSM 1785 TaxID=545697 RepID=L1QH14_9CLOT|nr:DivIVA domain-containing protein [Clostridium celatum]EKY26970.1 DivIVA domain protein [Clostridium celatum DSM 1785]MCE9654770.1 DivIVA domain-containing protein [Clostridium celatum]MDU3723013.1 DivIVA domain-containing protein [Clostridium celatum]MDU6294831.1 DivIVA domain-containing protein [Clostridium celatum]MDY3359272.1 DivIVA domain-containing protein [Clostridium celatum]
MKLTPMDINNKEFKKAIRGYSPEEVDEFLDDVVENYEELYKENSRLKDSLNRANEKIEHYEKLEITIQNTLLLAQNAADQAKESSEKQADLIISNANETAQRILDKAHGDVVTINDEYERVKEEFIKFRAKFRGFMNTQLQTFDELEKDLTKNYNVAEPVENYELTEKEVDIFEEPKKEEVLSDEFNDDMSEIKKFFANS